MTIRGFAGLPDGSEWIVDEVALQGDQTVAGRDEIAVGGDETVAGADEAGRFEAAGRELARRMKAAGASELLRAAEELAAR